MKQKLEAERTMFDHTPHRRQYQYRVARRRFDVLTYARYTLANFIYSKPHNPKPHELAMRNRNSFLLLHCAKIGFTWIGFSFIFVDDTFHTRQNGFSTMCFIDIRTQWKICHSAFETKSIERLHRFKKKDNIAMRTSASPSDTVRLLPASKSIQSKTKSSERNTICRNLNNQRVHATQTQSFEGAQHSPFRAAWLNGMEWKRFSLKCNWLVCVVWIWRIGDSFIYLVRT